MDFLNILTENLPKLDIFNENTYDEGEEYKYYYQDENGETDNEDM